MWLQIIGIFHFLHSPFLIVYPFVFNSPLSNLLYLNYFFGIMISYTFINGECPISYYSKLIIDSNYIAGDKVDYYPEMLTIFPNIRYVNYYFSITTTIYSVLLLNIIRRLNIPFCILVLPFSSLIIYVLFIRNIYFKRNSRGFQTIQEITKYQLLTTVSTLSVSYILYPQLFQQEDQVLPWIQP
jgi:hypothetical protein